jgi:hypothetical protein
MGKVMKESSSEALYKVVIFLTLNKVNENPKSDSKPQQSPYKFQ